MEETVSLQEIVNLLKKRIGVIIISTLVCLGISAVMTFFVITPKYSSQLQLIIQLPRTEVPGVNDATANLQTIATFKDLIKSDIVLNEVQQRLKSEFKIKRSNEALKRSISVAQSPNSQMISITATDTTGEIARNIANETAIVAQGKAKEMLVVEEITITSNAISNDEPISPNRKTNLLMGIILGLMLGVGLAFLLELFDKSVKDERFIEEELEFTVLGIVPNMTAEDLQVKGRQVGSSSEGNRTITRRK